MDSRTLGKQLDVPEVDFGVAEDAFGRLLVPVVHVGVAAVESEAADQQLSLVLFQELGRLRPVRDEPVAADGDDDGEDAFEDEDPSPPAVPGDPVHVCNGIGQQPAEGTRNDRSREEQIEAPLQLVSTVVHAEQVDTAGEEASYGGTLAIRDAHSLQLNMELTFKCSDDDSADHKTGKRRCNSLAHSDNAPASHNRRNED